LRRTAEDFLAGMERRAKAAHLPSLWSAQGVSGADRPLRTWRVRHPVRDSRRRCRLACRQGPAWERPSL